MPLKHKTHDPEAQDFQDQTQDIQTQDQHSTSRVKTENQEKRDPKMADLTQQMADMQALIADLKAQLSRQSLAETNQYREPTPNNSAFGGERFTPIGIAARPSFAPFGSSQADKNPNYDNKARTRAQDPGVFDGTKGTFEAWIIKIADKLDEDLETFRTERSRMALLFAKTTGAANDMLQDRYQSAEEPFSGVAEMVQTLATTYVDHNQAADARARLAKIKYEPTSPQDITEFISEINNLATKAKIAFSERKSLLYEHVPARMDTHLFRDSKDPTISYEVFCNHVADAAHAYKRGLEETRQYRKERDDRRSTNLQKPSSRALNKPAKETGHGKPPLKPVTSGEKGRALTEEEKRVHWDAGTCFTCGQTNHLSRNCPSRIAALGSSQSVGKYQDVDSEHESQGKE